MDFLKIGHQTNTHDGTGVTVFLFEQPAQGVYQICGSSPATRDLHAIEVESNAPDLHALVFTGGSAFGLRTVDGVLQYLLEKGIGKKMPHGGVVPIVPAAAIYDLAVKKALPPTADDAYEACKSAFENNIQDGCVGAGTGASVGKLIPNTLRMSGGLGHATIRLETGLEVSAYAVVNAVGDVRDQQGNIIAGARFPVGEYADCHSYLLSGGVEPHIPSSNTTLAAIVTNAKFSKIELKRICKVASTGMARAISPVFTRYDGDIIFCVSQGNFIASELTVGVIAAELIRQAIVNAVKNSTIIVKNE